MIIATINMSDPMKYETEWCCLHRKALVGAQNKTGLSGWSSDCLFLLMMSIRFLSHAGLSPPEFRRICPSTRTLCSLSENLLRASGRHFLPTFLPIRVTRLRSGEPAALGRHPAGLTSNCEVSDMTLLSKLLHGRCSEGNCSTRDHPSHPPPTPQHKQHKLHS